MTPTKTKIFLDHTQVKPWPKFYVLGCFERRVTLYSQQVRALNLVWSLYKEGRLSKGDRIAIIGGGVAGVTAAAAARHLQFDVTLLEARQNLMEMQRDCRHRWLHPRIYDWPEIESLDGNARLPLLNWEAADADKVVEQLDKGWARHRNPDQDITGASISEYDRNGTVQWTQPGKPLRRETFKVIIFAVGFGMERSLVGVPENSYWHGDSYDQRPAPDRQTRYLISGCGDGGLIDLLRVCVNSFRQERSLDEILKCDGISEIACELIRIEDEARKIHDGNAENEGRSAEHIFNEYHNLKVPEAIDRILERRDDTTALLCYHEQGPYTLKSSMLNRFLVSRLFANPMRLDVRKTEIKKQNVKPVPKTNTFRVTFPNGDEREFDRVIVRHGTESVLATRFQQIYKDCGELRARNKMDQTRERLWDKNAFGPEPPDDDEPPPAGERSSGSSIQVATTAPSLADYLQKLCETVGYVQLAGDSQRRSIQDVFVELEITHDKIEAVPPNPTTDASEDHSKGSKKRALEIETARRRHSPWEQKTEIISVEDLASVARRAVIVGAAGTGKSTMLRHIAYKAAVARLNNDKQVTPLWLPRLPSAGEVKKEPPVVLARRALEALGLDPGQSQAFDSLVEAIKSGRALILIDGVDEASKKEQQIAGDVNGWLNKLEGSILLASRPLDTGHLQRFSTLILHGIPSIAAEEMLTKYFPDEAWVPALIEKLRDLPDGYFWLETPVLLGLAATLYRGQNRLPDSLTELYEQAIDQLLRQRDLPEDDLGPEKRNALRDFARRMLVPEDRIPRIVFDRKELDYDNVEFFLRSGLFEGNEQLRFTHLTLGERLAAESNLDLVEERSRLCSMSVAAIEGNALEVLPMAHAIQAPYALVAAIDEAREHDLSDHRLLRLVLRAIGYGGVGVVQFCKTHADQIVDLVSSRLEGPSGRFSDAERVLMDAAERAFLVLWPFVDAEHVKRALGRVLDGRGEAAAEAHTMTWILRMCEPAPRVSYFEATINRQARALVRVFPDPEKVMGLTRGNRVTNHVDAVWRLARFPEYRLHVVRCVDSPEPYLRDKALEALAPYVEGERYWREAFTDSEEGIRVLAIKVAGETAERKAPHIERLRAALFDPAPRVRAAAVGVLADDDDARPVLRNLIRGELDPLKTGYGYFLQEALIRALASDFESFEQVERQLRSVPRSPLIASYFKGTYAAITGYPEWRSWFIKRLSAGDVTEAEVYAVADFPEAKTPLLSLLNHSNAGVVAAAIRSLGQLGATGTQFVGFLHNDNEQVRVAAIEVLGADQERWPLLYSFLSANASHWEQRVAVNALTADTSVVGQFEALLNSSDAHNVRAAAIDALSQSEDGRARLRSHFYARRGKAVEVDRNRGLHEDILRAHIVKSLKDDPDSAMLVEDALNDPDNDVQQAAVEALAENPSFRERFKKMFYAPETGHWVRLSLADALIEDPDIQAFFAATLAVSDNGNMRFAAFRYLVDRAQARGTLKTLFHASDTSDDERIAMIWPLARVRAFHPWLREIVRDTNNGRLHIAALRVLAHDRETQEWLLSMAENRPEEFYDLFFKSVSFSPIADIVANDPAFHPILTRHLCSYEHLIECGKIASLEGAFMRIMSAVANYEPAIPRLVELMAHEYPSIARAAMIALRKHEPVRERLINALGSQDHQVRRAAADALYTVVEARPLFRSLLNDNDKNVRIDAIHAMVGDPTEEARQALRLRLAEEPEEELRFRILSGIPSDPASVTVLRDRLHHDMSSRVRKQCANLLSPETPALGTPLTSQAAIKRILTKDPSLEPVGGTLRAFIQNPSCMDLDANVDVAEVLLADLCLQMVAGRPGESSARDFIGETQHPIERLSAPGSLILIRIAMDVSDLPRERSVRPTHNLIETWNRAKHLVAADPPSIFLACADVEFEHLQPPALEPGEVRWGPTFFGFRIGTKKTVSVGNDISASSGGRGSGSPRVGTSAGSPRVGTGAGSPRGGGAGSPRGGNTGTARGGNSGTARGGNTGTARGGNSGTVRGGNTGTARGGSRATSSSPRAISRPAGSGASNVGAHVSSSENAQPKPIEQAKLPVSLIRDVHQAAITMGLANSRQTLLGGLDPAIGAQIPTACSPLEQMLQDLQALNAMGRLRDGSFPLRHWLEVALALTNLRLESHVFEAALQILSE